MDASVIFVFLDGIGLAGATEHNPFSLSPMPCLRQLLNGPLVADRDFERPGVLLKGIDACLGVEGLPQSATGQTALFAGVNAAQLLGYHLTAYPNETLKTVLFQDNILKRATEMGCLATFANAYDMERYLRRVAKGMYAHSATTLSVQGAGLPFRTLEDLRQGQAVFWDITNETLVAAGYDNLPRVNPELAGQRLADLATRHHLVLYECFKPDMIGHGRNLETALSFLDQLDSFLNGLIKHLRPYQTLMLSSDHGNLEDLSTGGHTRNPVPLLAVGRHADWFRDAEDITDPMGIILRILEMFAS